MDGVPEKGLLFRTAVQWSLVFPEKTTPIYVVHRYQVNQISLLLIQQNTHQTNNDRPTQRVKVNIGRVTKFRWCGDVGSVPTLTKVWNRWEGPVDKGLEKVVAPKTECQSVAKLNVGQRQQ